MTGHEPAGGTDAGGGGRPRLDVGAMSTVHDARTEFEAECIRSVLEDAGIPSVVPPSGQGIFGFPLRAGGASVPVRVLPEDLSRARQVLAEARWAGKSIDWDDADVGEAPPEVLGELGRAARHRRVRRIVMAFGRAVVAVILLLMIAQGAWALVRAAGRP